MTTTEAPAATAAPTTTAWAQDRLLSTLALIAGIVAIVFGQTFFVPVAAMVLGVLGYRREPAGRAFAVWGIVLGGLMLFGWILLAIYGVVVAAPLIGLALF